MIVYIIVAVVVATSLLCFKNRTLFYKLSLSPYSVVKRKEWYRTITHSFVHGSVSHLVVNMLVFWSFGSAVLRYFSMITPLPTFFFMLLYFGAIFVSALYDISKQKNNYYYNSIGASAGVTALLFSSIFFNPWGMIYVFAMVPMPALLFGVLYIWYESYMSKQPGGNINHKAHIIGAIFGFLFPLVVKPQLFANFVSNLFWWI